MLLYCIPQQLACMESCPNNAFSCFSTGLDFCSPPHLFVACISLFFCQLSHFPYVYLYLYIPKYMKQDQGVVNVDIQCPPKLPVLSQAMVGLLRELAQPQGLLPEGSLDETALLVWVWGFGEKELEQKEDYNFWNGSEVVLRARQQLLVHFIHQSRHFPALHQGFFFYFLLPYIHHYSRCPFSCSSTSPSPIFFTVICVTPK